MLSDEPNHWPGLPGTDDARREDRRNHARHIQLGGRWELGFVDLVANLTLRVVPRDLALPRSTNTTNPVTPATTSTQITNAVRDASRRYAPAQTATEAFGKPAAIPAKMMIRNTVADAALRDLLTQPHQEHRSGDQGGYRRHGTSSRDQTRTLLSLQAQRDARPWNASTVP